MIIRRIIGIDPGLRVTGFGVIEESGNRLRYIACGRVTTDAKASLPERVATLTEGLAEILAIHKPEEAAIERVFVNVNAQSTLLLGQARGALLATLVQDKLPVAEYSALQVKQAVVGYGKAEKVQVQNMVARLLNLSGLPTLDAADALACALCHAHAAHRLANGLVAARSIRLSISGQQQSLAGEKT